MIEKIYRKKTNIILKLFIIISYRIKTLSKIDLPWKLVMYALLSDISGQPDQ